MYTKAPWKITGLTISSADGKTVICERNYCINDKNIELCKEHDANAHLISAAPEMFEWIEVVTKSSSTAQMEYIKSKGWRLFDFEGQTVWGNKEPHPKAITPTHVMEIIGEAILKKARGES